MRAFRYGLMILECSALVLALTAAGATRSATQQVGAHQSLEAVIDVAKDVATVRTPRIQPQYEKSTHVEITYEAFVVLPQGAMGDEFFRYLGGATGHDCSTLFSDSGTTITEGAYEEDCDLHFVAHFWDPDINQGLIPGGESALTRANDRYIRAVSLYKAGDVASAYYELGRVAHLLEDMAQPAHVHLDTHTPVEVGDNYEEICARYARRWSATAPPRNETEWNRYVGYDANGRLQPLDYTTLPSSVGGLAFTFPAWLQRLFLNLAETADAFESEDVAAETDAIQFGHPRSTISWHNTTIPPSGLFGEFSEEEALLHADTLVPLAIRYVASLYQLFWDETHPPTVITGSAVPGQTTATVSASVNPNGAATRLYFEYGKTTNYGLTATYGSVGSGTALTTKSYTLTNLSCGSTYHYRARAENNAAAPVRGGDGTFTTSACTQSCYSFSTAVNPMVGGTATVNTAQNCSGGYTSGTAVAISASRSSGYQFSGWTAANCTLANPAALSTTCTMTGTGNASVSAQFTADTPPATGSELLINGSFTSVWTGWARSGNFYADSRVCHSSPGCVYLSNPDGTPGDNLEGLIGQVVTIPSNATSATLTFWYSITTQEVTTTTAYDVTIVKIHDLTAGTAATIAVLSNLTSTGGGYQKRTADLRAYAGHRVSLEFSGYTDGAKPTIFRIDDVSIQVTTATCSSFTINPSSRTPSASPNSRTVTITGSPTGCQGGAWTASGNGSWLTVSPTSGTGSGSTVVSWSQNPLTSSRSANAMIAGNVFSVTQDGTSPPTCSSFTLNPSSLSVTSLAGSHPVTLIGVPNGCEGGSWTAAGHGSWLTVSPTSGTGPGSTVVSWSQNSNSSGRSGSATIAGNSFTVTQGPAPGGPFESYVFTHLAGRDVGAGYFDGTVNAARFSYPDGVTIDGAGNIYVADTRNSTIRKITPAGVVTTLAGLAGSRGSTDGAASDARFASPYGVASDSAGNLYVADTSNHAIRKITPAGVVTTLAGLAGSSGSTDGAGSGARFLVLRGIASDSAGNIYVADYGSHTIRRVTPLGVVTTLAGLAGSSGSTDGTGAAARFNEPMGVATDTAGNVYVTERSNHTIRKITPAGVVTTLAGLAGDAGITNGTGNAARFWFPSAIATDNSGNVYVADEMHAIRKITPSGVVTTLAGQASNRGSADGTGAAAQFYYPHGLATDSAGNVYVADSYNQTIRKVTPAGLVSTVAGLAGNNVGSADGPGSVAQFRSPFDVATDNLGNVYVADSSNYAIRKITPDGIVSIFAGLPGTSGHANGTGTAARFRHTHGVTTDSSGNVYVADSGNSTIRKITPSGVVTTLAGLANTEGSIDGTGTAARFNYPYSVAVDGNGNVYAADTFNHTIRKITPAGVVTTFAGQAEVSGSADGTGNAARFNSPLGLATDSSGNVYVADTFNDTIRKITPTGVVTTLAGLAGSSGSTDGEGSVARFNVPSGVEVDSSGNIYVADSRNNTIRKITPAGVVTTVAGLARSYGSTDGTGAAARFDEPSGVAVDSAGNLYVADQNNDAIRVGRQPISDAARIDAATGPVGTPRQLDVAPQGATSWRWTVIRRPSGSTAQLSSGTLRNPTFTPDVPDLYQFQLAASNSTGTSITIVSLLALPVTTSSYVLSVTGGGTGFGVVSGGGINCTVSGGTASGTCRASYAAGTAVQLTAAPIGGSTFGAWGGICSGAGGCSITMNQNKNVSAFFEAPSTGRGYYLVSACRLIDTRYPAGASGGPALAPNTTRNVVAATRCGIPSTAIALSINVTAVSPVSTGWLAVFPGPVAAPRPSTSTLSYRSLKTRANNAIAAVGTDGSINVYNGGSDAMHFIIDVYGYFQ